MKKVLILEDNYNTLECLKKIVEDIDENNVVFTLTNVREAYQYMLEHTIDVFIIDIILKPQTAGDTSGLYFAEKVRSVDKYLFTPMIFITSLEDTRYITYEKLHCYSFIEKPFEPKRVKEIVTQCLKYSSRGEQEDLAFFRNEGIIFTVNLEDIIYAETNNHSLYVFMKNHDVVKIPYMTVKTFLETANRPNLVQCSRSALVNVALIKNIDLSNRVVDLKTGQRIEIGITYKKALKDFIHDSYNCICD